MEKQLSLALLKVLHRYRKRLVWAFLGLAISNGLLVANPLIFRQALEKLNLPGFNLWHWVFLLLILAAISSCLKYFTRLEFISVSRKAERDLRSKLFDKIQNQSMEFFDRHGTGELLSRLTNDISLYRDVLGPGTLFPAYFITMLIPGLGGLFYISPDLAWISLLPLAGVPLINLLFRKPIYNTSKKLQEALAEMSNIVQEQYAGIRIVKAYGSENRSLEKFKKFGRHFIQTSIRLDLLEGLFYPLLYLLTKVVNTLLVATAGYVVYQAWGTLSSADFVSYMWIQSYLYFPILMLGWVLPVYQQARAAYDRIVEIYEEPIAVVDHSIAQYPLQIPPHPDIECRHLTFKYPASKEAVLKDINFKIKGGSFVGITGPTGSGKTTLFRILNREYEIPDGKVFVGGHDIHAYPLENFHDEIVAVEQIPFLFSKTIADNVRFGDPTASQEQVEGVARQAALHENVIEFPLQYETMVGERGVTLSGGQKQRIAMARAFLVDRSILLLDDIFSAVDTETEQKIFEAIQKNYEGKTLLLITHRVSILQQLDRIIYLINGKITEDGSPEELMAKNGAYAALVELQHFIQG